MTHDEVLAMPAGPEMDALVAWKATYAEINHMAVGIAMSALYDTHIEGDAEAKLRGNAIQALARFSESIGRPGLIQETESVPHSKRRRESQLWNKEPA